ncbi:MAG TPA: ABC transporter ATP-binding protein [Candidatus Acidoferrales bacterium]|nr:ABC transporter ATP-binding protein [Candidatus Acidoferrales bacterium]
MPPEVAPVSVIDVHKIYGSDGTQTRALDGVSLEVQRGEMVALVGPSGCGKSTLLNLIGCIDLPTSGVVRIGGAATEAMSDDELTRLRRDRIGTVFQFFNLLPAMTAEENVALPLVLGRRSQREIAQRVQAALQAVGLREKARAFPAQLSGGQMQRVAIARAIVHEPAIVLADEPTGNLDSENGDAILQLLRTLALNGQAILMATHAPAAAAVCDRTIHMRDGRIVS